VGAFLFTHLIQITMTERVQKAIDIFLDSLNDGTLIAGNCAACAVGNLVAANCGVKLYLTTDSCGDKIVRPEYDSAFLPELGREAKLRSWVNLFCTGLRQVRANIEGFIPETQEEMMAIVNRTGFTIDELAEIEYTFETVASHQGVIHALEAVVQVMLNFDDNVEDVKEVFTNKAEAIHA
jgi:hypothetical protein